MRFKLFLALFVSISVANFSYAQKAKEEKEQLVKITTTSGDIVVKLYNETPYHRDNFVKLIKEGYYDDLLFHRVIKDFMIQGGDPDSKNATADQKLGNGGPGYTIPAEIVPGLIHKKGALAAARKGDMLNPEKESSGSQFYIVQGKTVPEQNLRSMEKRMEIGRKQEISREILGKEENQHYITELKEYRKTNDIEGLKRIQSELEPLVEAEYAKNPVAAYTEEQIITYSTIGGTPHLDGGYTVFGEVTEGLNVLDSIGNTATKPGDRPVEDVVMSIKLIK